jgi:hypothetical protein
MTRCDFCGETSFYPTGPHNFKPCPLKVRESEARIARVKAEEEYWHRKRLRADLER